MTVEVVAGILVREGRVLLVQRRADKDFALTWECPGGKVEGPETHRDALQREWREELGILVTSMEDSPRFEREFSNPVSRPDRARIQLFLYRVEANGTPSPREGQGIGWFTPHEVETLIAAPGLDAARDVVVRVMRAALPEAPDRDCQNCGNRAMEPSDMNPYCSAVNKPWGKALHTGKPKECGPESRLWVRDARGGGT